MSDVSVSVMTDLSLKYTTDFCGARLNFKSKTPSFLINNYHKNIEQLPKPSWMTVLPSCLEQLTCLFRLGYGFFNSDFSLRALQIPSSVLKKINKFYFSYIGRQNIACLLRSSTYFVNRLLHGVIYICIFIFFESVTISEASGHMNYNNEALFILLAHM